MEDLVGVVAGQDGEGDGAGLDDDVATDAGDGLVLAQLRHVVGAHGGGTDDLEHDDGVGDQAVAVGEGRAGDDGVGVADGLGDGGDGGVGAERLAGVAGEAAGEGAVDVADEAAVAEVAAGHGDRAGAVELVARRLGLGPVEELLGGHRVQRCGHAGQRSIGGRGWFCLPVRGCAARRP